ncbi:unnamed protein product [Polarella glacialis]|uniref:Multidrug and toxin extrusion protein n=1 Tax=Polarella glacialis TaxID=89957 RepID=A0A813IAL2_POLGL|nr:unnamed protein product [Polarella glacialis]CAE8647426.1 unnamed protein product [Polarella glacialis]
MDVPVVPDGRDPQDTQPELMRDIMLVIKLAVPNIISWLMGFITESINIFFIGRTGDDAELAAIGLGNMMQNCIALSVAFGFSNALDTFVSQASGAQQYDLCAVYLQRCRVLMSIQLIWMVPLLWFSEAILVGMGQDVRVATHAGSYNRATVFGLFFIFQFQAVQKYLQNQGHVKAPAVIAGACSVLHIAWCSIFIVHFRLGNYGAGLANVVTWMLEFALGTGYLWYVAPELKQTRRSVLFIRRQALAFQGLRQYLNLGIPTVLALCSEWWFWEICALIVGYLGPTPLAAHVATMNVVAICFMVVLGIGASAAQLVGAALGAGRPKQAWRYCWVCVALNLVCWSVMALCLVFGAKPIAFAYTKEPAVSDVVEVLVRIFAVIGFLDSTQNIMGGVLRGVGRQRMAAIMYCISYYVVMTPLSVLLGFPLDLGIYGIWYSMGIGTGLMCVGFSVILCKMDWQLLAVEASDRLLQDSADALALVDPCSCTP